MGNALARRRQLGGRDQVDVEQAVAVEVDERDPAASRLQHVVLRGRAAVASRGQACRLLELRRRGRCCGAVLVRGDLHRRRAHRRGVAAVGRVFHLRLAVAALEAQAQRHLSLEPHAHALEQGERRRRIEAPLRPAGRLRELARGAAQLDPKLGAERLDVQRCQPFARIAKRTPSVVPHGLAGPPHLLQQAHRVTLKSHQPRALGGLCRRCGRHSCRRSSNRAQPHRHGTSDQQALGHVRPILDHIAASLEGSRVSVGPASKGSA